MTPPPAPPRETPSRKAASLTEEKSASTYGRLFALILSALPFMGVPVFGLHRFYVGRVGSGILWLVTFGLFGIGQLVDIVMLAVGQFRDADGKRLLEFTRGAASFPYSKPVNPYSNVVRNSWTDSHIGAKLGNLFLNLVGAIFLVVSLVLGALLAVNLPEAIARGVFGAEVAVEIAGDTGLANWHVIANNVLAFVLVIVGTIAAALLMLSRRHTNIRHLARVPLSLGGMALALRALGDTASDKWYMVGKQVNANRLDDAFAYFFDQNFWRSFCFACVAFVASILVLAWPAQRMEVVSPVEAEAERTHKHEHHEKVV